MVTDSGGRLAGSVSVLFIEIAFHFIVGISNVLTAQKKTQASLSAQVLFCFRQEAKQSAVHFQLVTSNQQRFLPGNLAFVLCLIFPFSLHGVIHYSSVYTMFLFASENVSIRARVLRCQDNVFSFSQNSFAFFPLLNKAEFFEETLQCRPFNPRKVGVII